MRRMILVLVVFAMVMPSVFAQEKEETDTFSFDVGGGLYYDAKPLSGTAFDVFLVLFNLRGGFQIDGNYVINDKMSTGAELGVAYITAKSGVEPNTYSASLFDIPIYGFFRYRLGSLAAQPFVGLLITGATNSDGDLSTEALLAIGSRIFLKHLYAEVAYNIGNDANSFARFGVGYQFNGLFGF